MASAGQGEQVYQPLIDDLGALPRVDFSIKEVKRATFREISNSNRSNIDDRNLVFEISDPNKMWNAHTTYIEMDHKIVKKSNGDDFTDDEVTSGVARAEMLSTSAAAFKSATLYMNDVKIESCSNVFLRNLVLDQLTKRTTQKHITDDTWFYPEVDPVNRGRFAIAADATLTADYSAATAEAASITARKLRRGPRTTYDMDANQNPVITTVPYNPSTVVQSRLYLKDLFGYFRDNLALVVSNRIRVELELAKEGDGVIKGYVATTPATDTAAGRVNKCVDAAIKVTKVVMWADEVILEDTQKAEIYSWLKSGGKFTQLWKQHDVYMAGAPAKSTGAIVSIPVAQKYSKLGRIYVFCQSLAKTRGKQTFNRAMFDKVNITSARLQVNGSSILPAIPYEINFPGRKVSRLYNEFLDAQKSMDPEESGLYDYETYMETVPMIIFDCTHIGQSLYDQLTKTDLSVEIEFKASPVISPYFALSSALVADPAHATAVHREKTDDIDKEYQFYAVVESLRSASGRADGGVLIMEQISM